MRKILHPALVRARQVGDGLCGAFLIPGPCRDLLSIIASDGSGWAELGLPGEPWEHVSVKADSRSNYRWRVPNWREMCFVKDLFWSEDECVVQFHPAESDYVNVHPHVLHLWRATAGFPTPPKECV